MVVFILLFYIIISKHTRHSIADNAMSRHQSTSGYYFYKLISMDLHTKLNFVI